MRRMPGRHCLRARAMRIKIITSMPEVRYKCCEYVWWLFFIIYKAGAKLAQPTEKRPGKKRNIDPKTMKSLCSVDDLDFTFHA